MKASSILKAFGSAIFHLVALSILLVAFWPVAKWYYFHRPILGVDFFNTATYVRLLAENFTLPPWGFKYFWFGGSPIYLDFILSWFYPIALVTKLLPLFEAIKASMLVSFFLLTVFVYLAAYRLCKHQLISALLAVLVIFSANMYGSLTWGGSLPYFANQLFFPAVLWLVASFIDTGNKRWYWAGILALGVGLLGHAMNAGAFALVGAVMLLLFGLRKKPEKILTRLGEVIVFFGVSVLVAFRVSRTIVITLFQAILQGRILSPFVATTSRVSFNDEGIAVTGDESIIAFERGRFQVLFSDTNNWLFVLLGLAFAVFLVVVVVDRKKRNVLSIVPWILLVGFSVLHVFLNAYGIPFLPQAWYRAFWHFPIALALLIAAVAGYSLAAFSRLFKTVGRIFSIGMVVFSVAALGVVYQSDEVGKTIEVVGRKSSPSSAYPEAINLVRNDQELEGLLPKLTPEWLDPDDRNWRLYESDAQVNVWWNALFDMPLARGYVDPPQATIRMGHIFLTDQALGADGLVENFDYSPEIARNMALYYIDWNAIRYFEGGHVSISDNKAPSSYLEDAIEEHTQTETVGLYRLYLTESGQPEIMDIPQYLEYYRFADDLVSPVLSVSTAPSVLCLCDWPAYESLLKVLSMNNLHSRFLVTAYSEEPVDAFATADLSAFDVLILANYKYRNQGKAFKNLSEYVSQGGKVFIDTGGETKDSEALQLPRFFPFSAAQRTGLGREWELMPSEDLVFSDIELNKFSPPIFDDMEWKLSYPVGGLDSEAEVLLSQKDKPLLVRWKLGEGTVIWSGLNFAYHVHVYTNVEESRLYVNLLESLLHLEEHPIITGDPNFVNSRLVKFNAGESGRGILFKEQFYPGWWVRVNGKRARAYSAGPAFPGFIYVPLDEEGPIKAEFSFLGYLPWHLTSLFSLTVGLVLLDLSIFDGRFVGKRVVRLGKKAGKRIASWWEREEE